MVKRTCNHIHTAMRALLSHDSFKPHLKTHYLASPYTLTPHLWLKTVQPWCIIKYFTIMVHYKRVWYLVAHQVLLITTSSVRHRQKLLREIPRGQCAMWCLSFRHVQNPTAWWCNLSSTRVWCPTVMPTNHVFQGSHAYWQLMTFWGQWRMDNGVVVYMYNANNSGHNWQN